MKKISDKMCWGGYPLFFTGERDISQKGGRQKNRLPLPYWVMASGQTDLTRQEDRGVIYWYGYSVTSL